MACKPPGGVVLEKGVVLGYLPGTERGRRNEQPSDRLGKRGSWSVGKHSSGRMGPCGKASRPVGCS